MKQTSLLRLGFTGVALLSSVCAVAGLPDRCPVEQVRWPYGPSLGVSGVGTTTVYGSGAALRVLDTSNPEAPVVLGEVALEGPVYDVEVVGRYAYVAAGWAGLKVIDIVDPSNPVVVAELPYSGSVGSSDRDSATGIETSGDRLLLFGNEAGATVVDVSIPTSPVAGSELFHPSDQYLQVGDAGIHDGYAVVSFDSYSDQYMYFYDLTDVMAPINIASFHLTTTAGSAAPGGVEWVGNAVYAVGLNSGLWVVDVTDPTSPFQIGWANWFTQYTHRLEVSGDLLLGLVRSFIYGSLEVWDISTPSSPVRWGWGGGPRASDLHLVGTTAFVANHSGGLQVVDLTNPSDPTVAYESGGSGSITDLTVTGAYGLATYERDGVASFELSSPTEVVELDRFLGTEDLLVARAQGSTAFVSSNHDLFVIDASNPSNLTQLGTCSTGAEGDLAISGALGIAPSDADIVTLDVSDPTTPAALGICPGPTIQQSTYARAVATGFEHAYVTIEEFDYPPVPWKFQICDVLNPAAPIVISRTLLGPDPADLLVRYQHLLMATETGLQTYDLMTPAVPVADGWLALPNGAEQIDSLFDVVFATFADDEIGLLTIDASNLTAPAVSCTLPTAGVPVAISVSGGRIFVALEDAGIQVFHYPNLVFADDFESGGSHHWDTSSF